MELGRIKECFCNTTKGSAELNKVWQICIQNPRIISFHLLRKNGKSVDVPVTCKFRGFFAFVHFVIKDISIYTKMKVIVKQTCDIANLQTVLDNRPTSISE